MPLVFVPNPTLTSKVTSHGPFGVNSVFSLEPDHYQMSWPCEKLGMRVPRQELGIMEDLGGLCGQQPMSGEEVE